MLVAQLEPKGGRMIPCGTNRRTRADCTQLRLILSIYSTSIIMMIIDRKSNHSYSTCHFYQWTLEATALAIMKIMPFSRVSSKITSRVVPSTSNGYPAKEQVLAMAGNWSG